MKKLITVSLLLISVSISFSQSKKKQIETLTYKLDSINSVLLRSIDDNEKLSDTKLALESKISLLKKENASKNGEISLKNEKIESLTKEVKSLEQDYQLVVADLILKSDSIEKLKTRQVQTSYLSYGDDVNLEPLEVQTEFDFEYVYTNGNGFNPPVIYPIGLNYNGYIAYKIDYCSGMCGCCSSDIVVIDLKSNQTLKRVSTSADEMDMVAGDLWTDEDYYNSVSKTIKNYNIIPIGFGKYNTSKTLKYSINYEKKSIDIILESKSNSYELKTKTTENTVKLEYRGNLEYEEYYESWSSVEYAGHFINNVNNYAVVALMHSSSGVEGENDYNIEFIGIKLPD